MKLQLPCTTCSIENKFDFSEHLINNTKLYEFTCSNGHKNSIAVQNPKHEILFESGIHALNDGYIREALSSFYASLECFYDFGFLFFLIAKKSEVPVEVYNEFVKKRLKYSERKVGAFYSMFLYSYKESPPEIKPKVVELRNKVIHGSYIPTKEEVINFGNDIKNYIFSLIHKFEEKFPKIIYEAETIELSQIIQNRKFTDITLATSSSSYFLSRHGNVNERIEGSITDHTPINM